MMAIKSIKEAFRFFIRNKTLWGIAFALAAAYSLFSKVLYTPSLRWLTSLYLALYSVISEIVLINAVVLQLSDEKIDFKLIQESFKKKVFHAFVFLILYFFPFAIFLVVFVIWTITPEQNIDSLVFYMPVLMALVLFYLLPYYFSIRFVVLKHTKIGKAISKTVRLYWGRILDTISLALFIGVMNFAVFGLVIFISFYVSIWFGESFELSQNIYFLATLLNTPVGTFLSLIATSFSTLWVSSAITVYFKKIEELGEFSE